jgi:hypothetical protein
MSEGGGGGGDSQAVNVLKRGLVMVSSAIGGRSGDGLSGPGAESGARNLVFATALWIAWWQVTMHTTEACI